MLRPSLTLLAALLLALGGRPASAQAAPVREPLAAVANALPSPALLRQSRLLGRQAQSAEVSLALTLPLRNQDALHALLQRLYDRSDPAYGHYLSGAEFNAQFAPTAADYQAVVDFAQANGLTVRAHAGRTVVGVSGTSGAVEAAFGVHLNSYQTPDGRIAYANDVAPRVPASVAARLGGIFGLDTLIQLKSHRRGPTAAQLIANAGGAPIGSDPSGGLTPTDIKSAYNLNSVGLAGEGQSLALLELDGYNQSDISQYNSQYGLGVNLANTLDNIYVAGYNGAAGSGQGEVVLDIDLMLALAPKAQRIYVYEASDTDANFLEVETQIADDNKAQSVSCSWGSAETNIESGSTPTEYGAFFDAENANFEKMAAQGQSFFAAAGDNGAYDTGSVSDGLSVDDPGSQPYVTDVGGTSLSVNNPGTPQLSYQSETTWNNGSPANGAGGGGESIFWAKPSYQYNNSSPLGASSTMRDVPDVSLDADPNTGYAIYVAADSTTGFEIIGGTSAAAPLWAAFTALVNEARATGATTAPTTTPSVPASPLGFANPAIYDIGTGKLGSYANDFHDITTGNNLFYAATTGYDDATGWGSFNGINLLTELAGAAGTTVTSTVTHTFPAGLQMISEPFDFSSLGTDFAGLFGLTLPLTTDEELVVYQPLVNAYAYYPTPPANTLLPGLGYWLRVPASVTLARQGAVVASPFSVTLPAGWNQIGDPFINAVPFTDVTVSRVGGGYTPATLDIAGALAFPILYTYAAGATAYTPVSEAADANNAALQPFTGYWLYAYTPITLTYTDPG